MRKENTEMDDNFVKYVEKCYVIKLEKNFEEFDDAFNHNWRTPSWDCDTETFLNFFKKETNLSCNALTSLVILYKELQTDGQWNDEKHKRYSEELNCKFKVLYGITLENMLKHNKIVNCQDLFDNCLDILHQKLNPGEFKQFPSKIEVYCLLIKDIKEYDIIVNPQKTLAIALLLLNDYINSNKKKGLQCCHNIIQCLSDRDFQNGNYYEVIYSTLMNNAYVKDLELTKLTQKCFTELLRLLPSDVKVIKTECLFTNSLEQLCTESNLYRKAIFFQFIRRLIKLHGTNCIKRKKMFRSIVYDSLGLCDNEAVREIVLLDVLECLEEWLKYSWCVWKFSQDHKLLAKLIKAAYVTEKDEEIHIKILKNIKTLITLSTESERKQILDAFEKSTTLPVARLDTLSCIKSLLV